MMVRALLAAALCASFWLPAPARAQDQSSQPIPAPAHGKKKKRKGYDYDQSQYKAYRVLTDEHHYRFDKDGNPLDGEPVKKVATKGKRKRKPAAPAASASAAPAQLAHAHFESSVADPNAPPASGAPRSQGNASGSAPVVGGACAGDTCSQPPGAQ